MRKPRLRLSHDLVGTRSFILYEGKPKVFEQSASSQIKDAYQAVSPSQAQAEISGPAPSVPEYIAPSQNIEPTVDSFKEPSIPKVDLTRSDIPNPQVVPETIVNVPQAHYGDQKKAKRQDPPPVPKLIELLEYAQIISGSEVQALKNQMAFAPEIPLKDLILGAGYVTQNEMNSLLLAETLITQGKITLPQFAVAMYDERYNGTRMAESLQNRGWLETNVSRYSG